MRINNVFVKILIAFMLSAVITVMVLFGIVYIWASNTEVEMIGKTCVDFVVLPGQVVDYQSFIMPNGETEQLEEIDENTRRKIADYMRSNNLKLKEGHHYFNRIDGTYDEYINQDFKFEKIN